MNIDEAAQQLQAEWGMEVPKIISEEAILAALADRVARLIDEGKERFFQLMYRLDISEKKLFAIGNSPDSAMQIARLIYDRQLQKIESRARFRNNSGPIDESLKW